MLVAELNFEPTVFRSAEYCSIPDGGLVSIPHAIYRTSWAK